MLCFRVFVRIHSRRSLDSFLDLNPILCPRFLNSFPCHTSAPRGPSHFGSAHLPSSSCRRKGRRRPQPLPHFCLSPILFLFTFLRTLLHFLAFSCTRQKPNSFVSNRFRTLCQKHRGGGTRLFKRPNTANCERLEGTLFHGSPDTERRTRVTSHCHPRRRSVIIRKKPRTNNS